MKRSLLFTSTTADGLDRTQGAVQLAGAITRVTESPAKHGFSLPSTSRVKRVTTYHQPLPISSTETTSARPRTRANRDRGGEADLFVVV